MNKYIIYVNTKNNTNYYYTNKGYNTLNITNNISHAKEYNTFNGAKQAINKLNLFNKYSIIKNFESLNIELKNNILSKI